MDRVHRLKPGYTLPEVLISLCVMGLVVGLAVHAAKGQLRFYRDVGDVTARGGQLGHATRIAASLMWGVSPSAGDILAAQDSALELRMPTGVAVVCESAPGRVTIPARSDNAGNLTAAFTQLPQPDDEATAWLEDSLGATWLDLRVAAGPIPGGPCPLILGVTTTWMIELREQLPLPAGTVLRFSRRLRLGLYRASDGRSYLGARDWNGSVQRFNGIQPIAGPLRPYNPDPAQSGLLFDYRDAQGAPMAPPFDSRRLASVRIVARADSDSAAAVLAFRNER